jgi:hypothetical protein
VAREDYSNFFSTVQYSEASPALPRKIPDKRIPSPILTACDKSWMEITGEYREADGRFIDRSLESKSGNDGMIRNARKEEPELGQDVERHSLELGTLKLIKLWMQGMVRSFHVCTAFTTFQT